MTATAPPPSPIAAGARPLLASLATSAIALVTTVATPALIQTYVASGGLTDRDAGLLFSLEVAAYAAGALLLLIAGIGRLRQFCYIGMAALVLGDALSGVLPGMTSLAVLRALAGAGSGIVTATSMVVIGATANPDRNFSWWTLLQLAVGALALIGLPGLVARFGVSGFFAPIAIAAAVAALAVGWLPNTVAAAATTSQQAAGSDTRRLLIAAACLAGIFIYYAGQFGVWTYAERIAVHSGLAPRTIQNALTASMAWAMGGAVLATLVLRPTTRGTAIVLTTALAAVSMVLIGRAERAVSFHLAVGLFNAGWYFSLPALIALIAEADISGRLISWLAVIMALSSSAGPGIAAMAVQGSSYAGVLALGIGSVVVGLMLAYPAMAYTRAQRRLASLPT